jgi:lactoylglutathione lyase
MDKGVAMSVVPIQGLWETHITVSDLDRSIRFYRDVVGLSLAHTVPERHVASFWIGEPRQAKLGLWNIHTSPISMKLHYAFEVTIDDVIASVGRLRSAGLECTRQRQNPSLKRPSCPVAPE